MHDGKKHIILASPPKCGTNLVIKLLIELGYQIIGDVVYHQSPKLKPGIEEALWAKLRRPKYPPVFGSPLSARRYRKYLFYKTVDQILEEFKHPTCFVLHDWSCHANLFHRDWYSSRNPLIILNYRDPRDQLISFVRFLEPEGKWSADYSLPSSQFAHAEILKSLPNEDEKITHAIQDETFPLKDAMLNMSWLLKNPYVCKVKFEDLVGPHGGGEEELQISTVKTILDHLGVAGDSENLADILYGGTPTFTGNQSRWRDVFTKEHIIAFNQRFGIVLDTYGYPRN